MKQGSRLFVRPGTFFSQLQWSPHHWLILIAFILVALVEPYVGKQDVLYRTYAHMIQMELGVSLDVAIWLFTAIKILLMVGALYLFSSIIFFMGNVLGRRRSSRRVFFRRLAVVFTVLLLGYTASHLIPVYPLLAYVTLGFYIWGGFLGFLALKEQFELSVFEGVLMCVFSIMIISGIWQYTGDQANEIAKTYYREAMISKKPLKLRPVPIKTRHRY